MRFLRGTFCVVLALAASVTTLLAAGEELKELKRELAVAEQPESPDNAAIAELTRRILELEPHDQTYWEKRARVLLKLGDLKRCEETLDAWNHEDKQVSVSATDIAGDLAYAQQHYDKALEYWAAYLKLQPRSIETYQKIADRYEEQAQWDKAEEILTKVIALEDTASTRAWRAHCRLELRRWDDALADIKKANALDATDSEVETWLPQFERLEKWLPQLKALDQKIAQNKTSAPLLLDRGLFFIGLERNELALEDADAALALTPKSRRAILQKAQALILLNKPQEVAKLHVIVKSNKFTNDVLRKMGAIDLKLANLASVTQSEDFTRQAETAAFTERARACSDMEQYALALEDAQAAVKLDSQSAEALVEQGFAAMKLGQTHQPAADFARAAELDPKNAIAWRSLGELAMDRADYPVAIDDFTRSLALHESPLVLKKREECYRYSGNDKEAEEDLKRWVKLTAKPTPKPATPKATATPQPRTKTK